MFAKTLRCLPRRCGAIRFAQGASLMSGATMGAGFALVVRKIRSLRERRTTAGKTQCVRCARKPEAGFRAHALRFPRAH